MRLSLTVSLSLSLTDSLTDSLRLTDSLSLSLSDCLCLPGEFAYRLPHELYVLSEQVRQLVGLSEGLPRDQSFARQLLRKLQKDLPVSAADSSPSVTYVPH